MPIKVPGKRMRNGKMARGSRTAVAPLSLTAMVDMFTVLVVFLLMNYSSTGEVIPMKENVALPEASSVKELEPSNVVMISAEDGVELNGTKVADFKDIQASEDWVLETLRMKLEETLKKEDKERQASLRNKVKTAVSNAKNPDQEETRPIHRVTIQADKSVDILSLKKIMYTITEAGGEAINFAVMKQVDTSKSK